MRSIAMGALGDFRDGGSVDDLVSFLRSSDINDGPAASFALYHAGIQVIDQLMALFERSEFKGQEVGDSVPRLAARDTGKLMRFHTKPVTAILTREAAGLSSQPQNDLFQSYQLKKGSIPC
jgi:hypothetical protein